MRPYSIQFASPRPTIVLIGAHCDDIEIGCGATVRQLALRHPQARFVWVTLSADDEREAETRHAASLLLQFTHEPEVRIERFRGSYFPHIGPELKDYFEGLKGFAPQLILTHCRHDLHQDHRVVNELTWNTFRDHAIWEYEIPKFDGDLSVPNVYVPLSRAEMQGKCDMLMQCFPSQHARTWFTPETFSALARLRGIECQAPEGYAEAFFGRKISIEI